MAKIIIATKMCVAPTVIHDRWIWLFKVLGEKFGFLFCPMEKIKLLPKDVDTVLLCASPKQINSDWLVNVVRQNKGLRLITYIVDLHTRGERFSNLLEGSDVVLSIDDERFRREWPQFVGKFVFFPMFFAPHARYTKFLLNERPTMRCLFAGASSYHYPLRELLNRAGKGGEYSGLIDVLPYHGTHGALHKGAVVRDAFAERLHSYFCVATSTVYQCVVSKIFEILATGALLLTNRVKDMDRLGFVPMKHYVSVTADNVLQTIRAVLAKPGEYQEIRKVGMEFVRAKHSINNRAEMFGQILKGLRK